MTDTRTPLARRRQRNKLSTKVRLFPKSPRPHAVESRLSTFLPTPPPSTTSSMLFAFRATKSAQRYRYRYKPITSKISHPRALPPPASPLQHSLSHPPHPLTPSPAAARACNRHMVHEARPIPFHPAQQVLKRESWLLSLASHPTPTFESKPSQRDVWHVPETYLKRRDNSTVV